MLERVGRTAKIIIRASDQERKLMANAKKAEFFCICQDIFAKRSEITHKEIKSTLKKLCPPGINFNVVTNTEKKHQGSVAKIYDDPVDPITTVGYIMNLPFVRDAKGYRTLNKKYAEVLFHEVSHFFDFIYNPKIASRLNSMPLFDRFIGYGKRAEAHYELYETQLYAKEFQDHLGISKDPLRIKQRSESIKNKIYEHFNKLHVSSEEKIEILQKWRYSLLTEKDSYTDGIVKNMILNNKPDIDQAVNKTVNEEYFFTDKIAIVENCLKAEISKFKNRIAEYIKIDELLSTKRAERMESLIAKKS